MHISRKQSAALAAVLGVSALTGWWAGAFSGASHTPVSASPNAVTGSGITAPPSPDNAALAQAGSEPAKLTKEEIAAAQVELLAILKSGSIDDGGPDGNMVRMMRQAARAACLFSKLTKSEQEDVIGQLPEADRGEAFMMVKMLSAMMGPDGVESTGDYVRKLAIAKEDFERMPALLQWAGADPSGLLAYWKTEAVKPDVPDWLKSEMGVAFLQIASTDPRLLLREAMTLEDPALRKIMLNPLHLSSLYAGEKSQWAADSDALLKQLLTEKPEGRDFELSGVLNMRMKRESPGEARAWVESLDLGPDSKTWTDKAVFDAWRIKDRTAAAQWMLENTPPDQRADSIAEFVSWWTDAKVPKENRRTVPEPDIAGCADWILALGIGPDTEKGISVLADGWIQAGEPAAALAWAQSISDSDTRASSLEKVKTQIERRYPDTWRAMLSAAGLPAAPAAAQ